MAGQTIPQAGKRTPVTVQKQKAGKKAIQPAMPAVKGKKK